MSAEYSELAMFFAFQATGTLSYIGINGAASTMAARRLASKIWRVTTGEEPPTRK